MPIAPVKKEEVTKPEKIIEKQKSKADLSTASMTPPNELEGK